MFFDLVFGHRGIVIVSCLALIAVSGFGLTQLKVSTDNRIFYGEGNKYFQDYLDFESTFTTNDNVLFVIDAPYEVVEPPYPEAIRWLTDQAASLGHVIRVDSLSNYPHPSTQDETLVVESILEWMCPTPGRCRGDFRTTLADTHLVNRLVSEDLRSTGVLATVSIDRGSIGEIEALNEESRALTREFESNFPGFKVYFTGGVPMMAAFAEATANDLGVLLPAALALIAILLALVLGSIRMAGIIVCLGLTSIIVTLGLAGWAGHVLNNATSIVPLIVFTLVVTSSMHVAVHFSRNLERHADLDRVIAQARASLSSSMAPMAISAATSAVGLCSLWFVDSPPIRQLGLLSALGVVVGFLVTVCLLPILLVKVRTVSMTRLGKLVQSAINVHARRVEAGKNPITPPSLVLIACASGLAVLHVNDDFVGFFDESVPFRVHTDKATELLAGPNHIEVVVSNDEGSVFEPSFLDHLSSLTEHLRDQPLVANAHSFSDVMDEVAKAFSDEALGSVESADQLAQLFLVYELSLRIGQTNTDLISADQTSARVSVLLKESTSAEIKELERQTYAWHDSQNAPYDIIVTGENIPVAHLSWMNIRSMVAGIVLSLAFTATLIGIWFASLRLGAVALVSTILPIVAGFGLWGWINNEIGLAATAVIALTVGVVVDDAAHYMYRFLDASRRLDLDPTAAAAYATHRAGAAIASTSVVMGLGLSLLLLSTFEVNSSFGAVACIIVLTALFFNLTLLPRLTIWAVAKSSKPLESFA